MATITKRGNTYRVRVSCGYDVNGKQQVKTMTYKPDPTKSDKWNEKKLNEQAVLFENECKHGQTVTAAKFETFAREWFKSHVDVNLKRTTQERYHGMENRMYAALGHLRVDKVNAHSIQDFVNSLVADGLGARSVKLHFLLVSVILNHAVKRRIIIYNPCVAVICPTSTKKERDFYNVEEMRTLLKLLRNEPSDKKPY